MKKLLTERQLVSHIRRLLKEQLEEVLISPEEYKDLLKRVAGQANGILRLPKFKGKKLVVNGDLNLEGDKRITDLGPIKINGNLNVSYTNIKSLDNVEVTGWSRYWETPYTRIVETREKRKKLDAQEELRQENAWDIDNTDEEGEMANAAFIYAMDEGLLTGLDEDDKERVDEIKNEISDLEDQQNNLSSEEEEDYVEKFDQIQGQIDELQDEWDEIISGKVDVYDLYPNGGHYHMKRFTSLEEGYEFAVGTYQMADDSLEQYFEELLESPKEYFSKDFLEYHVDGDEVASYFEESIRENIYDDPENYGISKELSRSQEGEIWLLEMERWVYENEGVRAPIEYPTKVDNNTFEFDDAEENSFQYKREKNDWILYKDGQVVPPHQIYDDEDTQEHEDERESRISDIDYEIDEIKENPDGEPNEDEIDNAVENELYDIRRNPVDHLNNYGYDIDNFIDKQRMLKDLIDETDYGNALNGNDGTYDTITFNGTDYIVMKVN
jgi:hypothetical protein